jgi:hypothetical protein
LGTLDCKVLDEVCYTAAVVPRNPDVDIILTFKVKSADSRARTQALDALRRGVPGKARHLIAALKADPSTSSAVKIIRPRR